jgi:hypothetical protein
LFIVQSCFFAGSGGYYFSTSSRKGIYMKTKKKKQLKTFKLEGFSCIFQIRTHAWQWGNVTRVGVLPVSYFHQMS